MAFDVSSDAYDRFMGRFSAQLAGRLAGLLEVSAGQRALDVGCGPGALTGRLVDLLGAERVAAVDPSQRFVDACRDHHPAADVRLASAEALPFADAAFDAAGACLVVHFMDDPVAGLEEMARVTRPGGRVGATVWDLAGDRAPMWPLWAGMAAVGEGRSGGRVAPGGTAGELAGLFESAGLREVEDQEVPVTVTYDTYDEWWRAYLHGVGPVGDVVASLAPDVRDRLEVACRDLLGDGPFEVTAVAFAVRGRVPG